MLEDKAGGYLTILLRCSSLKEFLGAVIDHLKGEGVWIVDIEDIVCTMADSDAKLRGREFSDAWLIAVNSGEISELPLHRYLDNES